MGQIRVRWGKFRLELPEEITLLVVFKLASWLLHMLNS